MIPMMRTALSLRIAAVTALALALAACGGSGSGNSGANSTTTSSTTPPDPIAFTASSYSVAQSAGSVSLPVIRSGTATAAVTVDYQTADSTAVAGTDYTATSGTLQWAENDSTVKMITVPISNSTPFTGNKTFSVALSNPSVAAEIAIPQSATVTMSGDATVSAGTLQLSDSSYTVAQNAGILTVTVNRVSGSSGAVSVAYATTNGTAVAGTDFTAASGTLNWADGDATSQTFAVAISNATAFSGSKTFSVALSNPASGAALGSPSSASVTITGSSSSPIGTAQFSATSYTVDQNAGTLTVSVDRTGGSAGAVSVGYATSNGTAVGGTDFTAASGTLNWADGDATAKTFTVTISNATPFSGNRTFTVGLSSPSGGVAIGNPGTASVTIAGGAADPMGSVEFSAAGYTVAQSAGTLTITVDRTGGSTGAVSVGYATSNGTAVAGTDFTAASGTLNWNAGDATSKTFAVAISNAAPFSGSKSFKVKLSGPGGGATLGSPAIASVSITGDSSAAVGSLQLSASTFTVAQTAGTMAVTVNRTGGSTGAVSVGYATSSGTAVAGTNFTATSGTLNWAAGDATSKSFSVAISNATPFVGSKSFTVALSSPSGGATLSSPSSATINISGSSSGSGGPSAPPEVLMTQQTGSSTSLSWTAATSGANPIAQYRIYRNGVLLTSTTGTSYTDTSATNATVVAANAPATIYAYAVTAVDTAGNESAQAFPVAWYWNGQSNFIGGDFMGGGQFVGVNYSYADTSDAGPYDIALVTNGSQSYSNFASGIPDQDTGYGPQLIPGPSSGYGSPQWAMELGAFNYMVVDIKPSVSGLVMYWNIITRGPPGDIYNNAGFEFPAAGQNYGPNPMVAGQWNHYKLPLNQNGGSPSQQMGTATFQGYISGTTMVVTTNPTGGALVQPPMWITGPGVPAKTYVVSPTNSNGEAGTYTISNSATVGSAASPVTLSGQRTNLYKMSLTPYSLGGNNSFGENVTVLYNKMGFTTQ